MDNLFHKARTVVFSPKFYYAASELLFGNPYNENNHASHFGCGIFPYCRKKKLFPALNRHSLEEIFFNNFYPKRNNDTIIEEICPWTIETLVTSICNYPGARWLLLQSKSRASITPSNTKKIIFTLLSGNILKINYRFGLKTTIFGLARKAQFIPEFYLKYDSF